MCILDCNREFRYDSVLHAGEVEVSHRGLEHRGGVQLLNNCSIIAYACQPNGFTCDGTGAYGGATQLIQHHLCLHTYWRFYVLRARTLYILG